MSSSFTSSRLVRSLAFGGFGIRLLFVMLILAHDRRKIVRFDVTQHPTAGWLSRQVTEAFPWDTAPRFLLRDRDASYGSIFRKRVEAMGITEVVTAPRSPWQNAYVERVIGSIRRECLDKSSSSTSAISAAFFHHTLTITTAPGHIFHWTKTVRSRVRSSRRRTDESSLFRKSAGCTTATNASRRDSSR
jgi:transposase InsO family protein